MKITIRTEQLKDYNKIAEINELAFYAMIDATQSTYLPEKVLVAVLRHGSAYDPELSLVAEIDGTIVGHALYYPFNILVEGEAMTAVSLGPIAVHPAFQKQGIGIMLMEEGHRRAKAKEHAFAFLLGHPSYYPKVGYMVGMFGKCQLTVSVKHIMRIAEGVEERLIQSEDIQTYTAMWNDWFHDVDLALFPGNSLVDWVTHTEEIKSYTMVYDGQVIGYLRYEKLNPANVKMFLAKDRHATELLLAHVRSKLGESQETQQINLPLHPDSQAVKDYLTLPYEVDINPWDAAMIKILDPENTTITGYCQEVRDGKRRQGLLIYPPTIEVAA